MAQPVVPDLVAYLPCPVKVPFEQAVEEYLASVDYSDCSLQLEGNANKSQADYEALICSHNVDELPALLITPGVNQLFSRRFITNVLDSGHYADTASYPLDAQRAESTLRDPKGHATVLAANVTVIVVDHTQLGARPVPRSWSELRSAEFAKSVIMRGSGSTFCETTLLAWQQLFGRDGLREMGRSVREGWHPAQMAKIAGTGKPDGAAAYVMPFFFARNIRSDREVSVIWPADGVIASPVTLFAKRSLPPKLQKLGEWLAGPTIARLFSRAGLPTPHPDVGSGLPVQPHYIWPGWDRARSEDLSSELSFAESAFASGHR